MPVMKWINFILEVRNGPKENTQNSNKNTILPEDPRKYNITEDIQVTHARIAVGTCGILGKGPGNSVERDYLPHADNDFIYAIIIEEGGIIFGSFVMFLYLLLLYRAYRIANKCKPPKAPNGADFRCL